MLAATHPTRAGRASRSAARDAASEGQRLNPARRASCPPPTRRRPQADSRPSGRREDADPAAGEGSERGGWQPSGARTGGPRSRTQAFLRLFPPGRVASR